MSRIDVIFSSSFEPNRGVEWLTAELLALERLLGWHAALFPEGRSGLTRIRAGAFRGAAAMQVLSGPLGKERVHFEAPPRKRLAEEMDRFLRWFDSPPTGLEGLLRAGLAHFWFVTVHPFEDGNGRLARAITDLALAQDEGQSRRLFSMSGQILQAKEGYYEILEREQSSSHGLDVTAWLRWFLEQLALACGRSEQSVQRTLFKARFWLRLRGADLNERQRKVLNRLLDAGPGGFQGGLNARKYVAMTRASKATATRDLAALVDLGCLIPTGKGGRSAGYVLIGESDEAP